MQALGWPPHALGLVGRHPPGPPHAMGESLDVGAIVGPDVGGRGGGGAGAGAVAGQFFNPPSPNAGFLVFTQRKLSHEHCGRFTHSDWHVKAQ